MYPCGHAVVYSEELLFVRPQEIVSPASGCNSLCRSVPDFAHVHDGYRSADLVSHANGKQ